MKKLITCLGLALCAHTGFAQLQLEDTSLITYERWRDTCFGLINKNTTEISSGYLLDYSLAAFESTTYDGIGTDDTIKSYGNFFSLHNLMTKSAVNANATLESTKDLFIAASRYKRDTKNIPIILFFQAYQKINPGALSNNLEGYGRSKHRS